jgi:hypothetical protein
MQKNKLVTTNDPLPLPLCHHYSVLTVQQNVHGFRFFSEVGDGDTRAANDLTGVTFTVNLAETGPFTELLGIRDLDQADVVFGAQGFNQLDVFTFGAGFAKNSQVSLTSKDELKLVFPCLQKDPPPLYDSRNLTCPKP